MREANRRFPRLNLVRAALLLLVARALVVLVPLKFWRGSLGRLQAGDTWSQINSTVGARQCAEPAANFKRARFLAGRVDRATQRLPGESKCLPRAAALQWMLGAEGIVADLVIAFDIHDRIGKDAYHAWVEMGGDFLIGHCDRAVYRPIMVFRGGRSGQ